MCVMEGRKVSFGRIMAASHVTEFMKGPLCDEEVHFFFCPQPAPLTGLVGLRTTETEARRSFFLYFVPYHFTLGTYLTTSLA